MSRTQTKWALGVNATLALLVTLGFGLSTVFAQPSAVTVRPIQQFVDAQGTLCLGVSPDCFLFVPPVDNFVGWGDPDALLGASVDYAGLADKATHRKLDTTFDGEINEVALPNGRAEVTVTLATTNALTWLVDLTTGTGNPFTDGDLLFGERVKTNGSIAHPVLGDSELEVVFIHTEPGAPMPDLLQLLFFPQQGQKVLSLNFTATATEGETEVTVTQICPSQCSPNFHFSVETVELLP